MTTIGAVRCRKTEPNTGKIIEWVQPILYGKERPLKVPVFGEEVEVPIYAVLAVIRDDNDRYLVSVGQEATSENSKNFTIRLPIQASSSKIVKMMAGHSVDKGIHEVMDTYEVGTIEQLFKKAEDVMLETPEDPDRILKHNLMLIMPRVDSNSELHQKLTAGSSRKWVTREQLDMIVVSGISNSHLVTCIDSTERADRLKSL